MTGGLTVVQMAWYTSARLSDKERCLPRFGGGIAQLVERLNGIQEARSSNLLTSTEPGIFFV